MYSSPHRPAMRFLDRLDTLTVVSPHLDDAVFSCGALLERAREARVITVFAGTPGDVRLTDWDRRCGFPGAGEAMRTRRAEDAQALTRLGAAPVWLELLDAQYGAAYRPADVERQLAPAFDHARGVVAVPLGLFHSDHALVHDACMGLCDRHPGLEWLFYEDVPYRRLPGLVQERLAALLRAGRRLTPIAGPPASRAKELAVRAYASQLRAFGEGGYDDTSLPERYWKLEIPCTLPNSE